MGSETPAAYVSAIFISSNPFLQFTSWINFLRLPATKSFILNTTPQVK